jgi:hypothetical protein
MQQSPMRASRASDAVHCRQACRSTQARLDCLPAQIALRVDMARIRQSPVAGEVRSLLAAIPDWKALLDGSGIDPIEQVDRPLIATPTSARQDRSRGALPGRRAGVRAAVERLAASKGVPAPWHNEGNVQVAPWANADATPRVIALVGPALRSHAPRICRACWRRCGARRSGEKARASPVQHPADALLSMEEGEGLSRSRAPRSPCAVAGEASPSARAVGDRARRSAPRRVYLPGRRGGRGRARLPGRPARPLREQHAGRAARSSGPLRGANVERSDSEVRINLSLTADQVRLILGYVRELLSPPARP